MLLNPLPLSQTVTPSRTPSLFERDVLYGRLLILATNHIQESNLTARPLRRVSHHVIGLYISFNKRRRQVSEGLVNLTEDRGHEPRSASTTPVCYSLLYATSLRFSKVC